MASSWPSATSPTPGHSSASSTSTPRATSSVTAARAPTFWASSMPATSRTASIARPSPPPARSAWPPSRPSASSNPKATDLHPDARHKSPQVLPAPADMPSGGLSAMGSASSTNATNSNLSSLLQTLSSASPQLSSLLSSSKIQSALAQSSPQDVVQLSEQALELQQTDLLFGSSIGTQSVAFGSGSDSLLSSLYSGSADGASNAILQALESSSA